MTKLTRITLAAAVCFIITLTVSCQDANLKAKDRALSAYTKASLYSIQLLVERYGIDNEGVFPQDISVLIDLDYLDEFPNNAYTDQPMIPTELDGSPKPGNFTYIPIRVDAEITQYHLLGYCGDGIDGLDYDEDGTPDQVYVILRGGTDVEGEFETLYHYQV